MNQIINDAGGSIHAHYLLGLHYAEVGAHLIVVYCASACLYLLAAVPRDHVCFRPSAWVGYHTAAQRPDGTESPTTMRWERGTDWIARGYKRC